MCDDGGIAFIWGLLIGAVVAGFVLVLLVFPVAVSNSNVKAFKGIAEYEGFKVIEVDDVDALIVSEVSSAGEFLSIADSLNTTILFLDYDDFYIVVEAGYEVYSYSP